MTGKARAPERRKFPVSARESPKLKIESYFRGAAEILQNKKQARKRSGLIVNEVIENIVVKCSGLMFSYMN